MTAATTQRRAWMGVAVLALPCMITVMDLTVLNLAVPRLTSALEPSGTQLLWIIDIYGFMLAGALIPIGGLGDRIGRRKLLLIGGAAFAAASLASAFSTSALMLIAARALLGVAGAALVPSTLSLLPTLFEDAAARTRAIGVWGASFAVGAAIGPLIGGVLLEHFWWGSVFLVGVPVMALLLILGPVLLPEFRDPDAGRPDLLSGLLSIAAILLVIYGLKQAVQDGIQWLPIASTLAGLVLAVVFIDRQRRLADPMVDLSLFRNRAFTVALSSNVLNVFVSFGSFILISQYLQLVLGLSPLQAGALSVPASLLAIVGPMLSPVLAQRLGTRVSLASLLGITAVGFGVQSLAGGFTGGVVEGLPVGLVAVGVGWALWALGGSAAATLTTGTVISSARPERAGAVSALGQTGAELGGALGIAVLGSVGTSIYRSIVISAIPEGLSPDLAAAARDTLGGALNVAAQLADPAAAASLIVNAQHGMTLAVEITSIAAAVISAVTAIAVSLYFEAGREKRCREEECRVPRLLVDLA